MARIAWTEQMSVGVPEIDRQHQRLVDLFNGLEEGLLRGGAPRILRGLFAELASYTRYHFTTEAHVLRMDEHPALRAHLDAHEEFVAKLADLEPLLQREGAWAAAMETSRFLRSWILRHIVVADRLAFAEHRARPSEKAALAEATEAAAGDVASAGPAQGDGGPTAVAVAEGKGEASGATVAGSAVAVASK
jgi:hemerythrin